MEYTFVLEKPIEKRLSLSVKQGVESDMKRSTLKNLISVAVCLLFLLHPTFAEGKIQYNNVRFKQLSITEGLSHNTVNAISQDSKGFMWFGTRNGLCRYDGYNITRYFHEEGDSTTISHVLSPNYIMTPAGMSSGFLRSKESANTIPRMNNSHAIT